MAETDFGQTDFGHPYLTDFGQNWGWPTLAKPTLANLVFIFLFFKKTEQRKHMEEQTPKGWGPEGWGPEGWGGPNLEKVGPRRVGPRRVGPRRVGPEGWGAPKGWGPEGWGPEGWGPEGWGPKPRKSGAPRRVGGPEGWGAQISLFFFPFPATISLFSVSLWVSSRGILVVFEASRALKCARLEFSGCRVRAPAARSGGAAGVSHDSPRAQTCTF